MKPIRLLVALVPALVLALSWGRCVHATSFVRWLPDMSREQDSLPPSRPSEKLVAIHRAGGTRSFYSMIPRDGMPDTGWCKLYIHWQDWQPELDKRRDPLHAGVVFTCLDRAENQSQPSDTLWIDAPAAIAVGATRGARFNAFVTRRAILAWSPDSTLRDADRAPPVRPRAMVVAIQRGVNLESQESHSAAALRVGSIRLALRSHDDQTAESKLGYRLRLAAGDLPDGLRLFGDEPVISWEDESSTLRGGRRLDLDWADWIEGQPGHCCAIHFGLLITCVDLAGNESAPSDTVWVEAPPR